MNFDIHHVGYMVKNIKKAQNAFIKLGFVPESRLIHDAYRKINIVFMEKNGYRVELVCPTDKESKVADLCRRIGNSPYHICYICEELKSAEAEFRENGYMLCDTAHEAIAFDGRKVCFYIHPFLGMVELLEEKRN